ncbi:MAG: YceI family protein [Phycisphaerales bacterium]
MNALRSLKHSVFAASLALVFSAGLQADASDEPLPTAAPPSPIIASGLGLEIPEELSGSGTVYHLLPGRAVQATFRSTTPIETFTGETDSIIGYAVIARPDQIERTLGSEADDSRGVLLGAEFALPVRSIRTGIEMRDRHMLSSQWLDEENHPYIRFRLAFYAEPSDATPENAPAGSRTIRGELVGDLTIRGVTRPLRIEGVTLAMLPESASTRRVAEGDLMAMRCRYTLSLADFGITNAIVGRQVARSIEVDQVLYFSTVAPTASDQSAGDASESSSPEPSEPSDDR